MNLRALLLVFMGVLAGCSSHEHPPVIVDTPNKSQGRGGSSATPDEPGPDDGPVQTSGGRSGTTKDSAILGSALVGYFYDDSGILIADESGVVHYDWDGKKIAQWKAERPLLSAGYRDGKMMVADSAVVIGLNDKLESLFETEVVEACEDAVMVSGGHFICGPNVDWDRVLYTYDATTGDLLKTSEAVTYEGVPMVPLP